MGFTSRRVKWMNFHGILNEAFTGTPAKYSSPTVSCLLEITFAHNACFSFANRECYLISPNAAFSICLEILAFPCNQFGGQEPGTNKQIVEFACTRFKAEYPIFDKMTLKTTSISCWMTNIIDFYEMGVLLGTANLFVSVAIVIMGIFGMNIKIALFRMTQIQFLEVVIGSIGGLLG
ncbi:hypothetical protein Syun_025685 [Stephania yunnanensis]|uniref:Uncharacterized protein n=1 Tax=Stephania yunnanensis TaxID=152371 RepID=A0AAP0HWE1_9MAGN